jgi:hypothetical protein
MMRKAGNEGAESCGNPDEGWNGAYACEGHRFLGKIKNWEYELVVV